MTKKTYPLVLHVEPESASLYIEHSPVATLTYSASEVDCPILTDATLIHEFLSNAGVWEILIFEMAKHLQQAMEAYAKTRRKSIPPPLICLTKTVEGWIIPSVADIGMARSQKLFEQWMVEGDSFDAEDEPKQVHNATILPFARKSA